MAGKDAHGMANGDTHAPSWDHVRGHAVDMGTPGRHAAWRIHHRRARIDARPRGQQPSHPRAPRWWAGAQAFRCAWLRPSDEQGCTHEQTTAPCHTHPSSIVQSSADTKKRGAAHAPPRPIAETGSQCSRMNLGSGSVKPLAVNSSYWPRIRFGIGVAESTLKAVPGKSVA